MNDALLVRGFERVGDLPCDRQRVHRRRIGPRAMTWLRVFTLDEFHHQGLP